MRVRTKPQAFIHNLTKKETLLARLPMLWQPIDDRLMADVSQSSKLSLLFKSSTLLALLLPLAETHAMSLGALNVRSALGQPFKASLSVTLQPGEQLSQSCISIVNPRNRNDDLPTLLGLRSALENNNGNVRVWLVSTQSVNEPAVRVRLQVGCENPVQREFVVLLDPPADKLVSKEESTAPELEPKLEFNPRYGQDIQAQSSTSGNASNPTKQPSRPTKFSAIPTVTEQNTDKENANLEALPAKPPKTKREPLKALATTSETNPIQTKVSPLLEPGVLPPSKNKIINTPSKAPAKTEAFIGRDRLQLLAPDIDGFLPEISKQSGLRIASSLQVAADGLITTPTLAPEKLEEIRREQRKLMAYLRDEDVQQIADKNEATLKKQVADLNNEIATLRKNAQIAAAEKSDFSVMYMLGGAALLGLGMVIWLFTRIRAMQERKLSEPWWDAHVTQAEANNTQDLDEWSHTETAQARHHANGMYVPPAGQSVGGEIDTSAELDSKLLENPAPIQDKSKFGGAGWSPSLQLDIPTQGPLPSFDVSVEELEEHVDAINQSYNALNFDKVALTPNGQDASSIQPALNAVSTQKTTPVLALEPTLAEPVDAWVEADSRLKEHAVSIASEPVKPLAPELTLPDNGNLSLSPLAKPIEPAPALRDKPNAEKPGTLSPYKVTLAAVTMAFVEQTDDTRISYAQAKAIQEKLTAAAALLESVEKELNQEQLDNAISLLRHHVHENKQLPAAPWLVLFDLYKQTDRRAVYESLMVVFQRRFGRAMSSWEEYDTSDFQIGLDEMPELMDRIWQHWGTPQGMHFLQRLCDNNSAPDGVFFNRSLARDAINLAKILPLQGEE